MCRPSRACCAAVGASISAVGSAVPGILPPRLYTVTGARSVLLREGPLELRRLSGKYSQLVTTYSLF